MLVEFAVSNYLSFNQEQRFSMVAGTDKSHTDHTINVPLPNKHRLLSTSVMYGANASGKSNFISALGFVRYFVGTSANRKRDTPIKVQPFLLEEDARKSPSHFEIQFIHQGCRYLYRFAVDQMRVLEEELIAFPKKLPQKWFHRVYAPTTQQYEWTYGSHLRGERKQLGNVTREDMLFLSVGAQFNNEQLQDVHDWFTHTLSVISLELNTTDLEIEANQRLHTYSAFQRFLSMILSSVDTGIIDVSSELIPIGSKGYAEINLPVLVTKSHHLYRTSSEPIYQSHFHHKSKSGKEYLFTLEQESVGTRRLYALAVALSDALEYGQVLVIDELDTSFHPLLIRHLLKLFHDPSINKYNAQLIFNTHDVTLLDTALFRRDQIWFVEKKGDGQSHIYALSEFKARHTDLLLRGYLQGRYGAIPALKSWSSELISIDEGKNGKKEKAQS